MLGRRSGVDETPTTPHMRLGMALFVDEDGYTTVAVALALLLSLSLVFGMAAAEWGMARAADVQEVADAAAMAGSNCVAAFATVSQVIDACVLSLGLTGLVVCGSGLIVAAIPPIAELSPSIMDAGKKILDTRKSFATSSARGLKSLESALPALIMANSASCVSANSIGGMQYSGLAIPFPQKSASDFSFLDDDANEEAEEVDESAEDIEELSKKIEEARQRAQDAKERAWRADNIDNPLCMRSRAATLANMGEGENPYYDSPDSWEFEYCRIRACNYYVNRWINEYPADDTVAELTRSQARYAFYDYAYDVISSGICIDTEDEVNIDLPELPRNTDMMRQTRLYTDTVWPVSIDEYGLCTLHSSYSCPDCIGMEYGYAALCDMDSGTVSRCETCQMDPVAMGSVASASTNINNGFEHYWRIVVEASREYQVARQEEIEARRQQKEAAEQGKDAFDEALDEIAADRPKLTPPGAYGCVAVVSRSGGTMTPAQLTQAFVSGVSLPAGVAVSAATLAPDSATDGNNILSRVLDGVRASSPNLVISIVGGVTDIWGSMLVAYGSGYDKMSGIAEKAFSTIDIFSETIADWLRSQLKSIVSRSGMAPADMRLRKPVVVNSQVVLDKAGYSKLAQVRSTLESIPASGDELVRVMRSRVESALGSGDFTVATLPVPGLNGAGIPLTLDVGLLLGGG